MLLLLDQQSLQLGLVLEGSFGLLHFDRPFGVRVLEHRIRLEPVFPLVTLQLLVFLFLFLFLLANVIVELLVMDILQIHRTDFQCSVDLAHGFLVGGVDLSLHVVFKQVKREFGDVGDDPFLVQATRAVPLLVDVFVLHVAFEFVHELGIELQSELWVGEARGTQFQFIRPAVITFGRHKRIFLVKDDTALFGD